MMKILFLLLASTILSISSETLSWKVPLLQFASDGLDTPGLERLENPPEESPFFKKGDELWDLSDFVPEYGEKPDTPPEWAVWNATSGRVVAKGSWTALKELQRMIGADHFPRQARITVSLFKIPADGSSPDMTKLPETSLSLVARSGQKAAAINSNDKGSINLEMEPFLSEDGNVGDLRLLLTASLPDSPTIELNTSTTLHNLSSVWVARDSGGKNGLDIVVSLSVETPDGTPYTEVIQIQRNGEIRNRNEVVEGYGRLALKDGRRLLSQKLPPDVLDGAFKPAAESEEIDPFTAEKIKPIKQPDPLEVATPEEIAEYFGATVYDLKKPLLKIGMDLGPEDFAGYDPVSMCGFILSSNLGELDKFEQLFFYGDCCQGTQVAITTEGSRNIRLICRSGQKASLTSRGPESEIARNLEIEPTMGETETIVDLRVFYEETSGKEILRSVNTSATLEAGKFLKIVESASPEGSLKIKVEKIDTH